MRAGLTGRVAKVRAAVPEGCAACRGWPTVRYLHEGDPEPPTTCAVCGREWHGLTRVIRIVRLKREDLGQMASREQHRRAKWIRVQMPEGCSA